MPVEIVEGKRKNQKQKLIGAWTGSIIMHFESLSVF